MSGSFFHPVIAFMGNEVTREAIEDICSHHFHGAYNLHSIDELHNDAHSIRGVDKIVVFTNEFGGEVCGGEYFDKALAACDKRAFLAEDSISANRLIDEVTSFVTNSHRPALVAYSATM